GEAATLAKRSPLRANLRASPSWSAVSTFAQKCPPPRIAGHVDEECAAQNSTSGGSSDTDTNEFTAMPTGPSRPDAGTTTTPVAKQAITPRRSSPAIIGAAFTARPRRRTGPGAGRGRRTATPTTPPV